MTELDEQDDLRQRLRALRVDPAPRDFSASLHRKLVAAGPPEPPVWWRRLWPAAGVRAPMLWPALGAVAAFALLLAVGWGHRAGRPDATGGEPLAYAELPATKVAMVRVNLSAEVAVESAQIRVTLPEGLVFWADGHALAQRSFEWSQPLRAGDNDIPIAVRGQHPGRYRMTVTARMGKEEVEDEVLLDVVDG